MSMIAEYGVLRHQPYPNRTEHINIGIVTFLHDGSIRVHFASNLRKLRAFDPQVELEKLRSWERGLPDYLSGLDKQSARRELENLGTWKLSESLGRFVYNDEHEYTKRVVAALSSLVDTRQRNRQERQEKSRLFIDIKNAFSINGWLGRGQTDIDKHMIVPRYKLSPETGVSAEFALRNGKLHVLETVDFRTSTMSAKRQEAMSKALVFDLACELEKKSVNAYVVLAGGMQDEAKQTVNLLNRYAENVLHWEDQSDMQGLMNMMANATGKPMMDLRFH